MARFPSAGEQFEGYQLTGVLGEGGFGVVFAALDASGRKAAVKVLIPGRSSSTPARFAREAAALAKLQSAHTVQLLGSGVSVDGFAYLAFEFIEGETLEALLGREGILSEDEATAVLRQVLSSLQEAHGHGLLHRDIKPANVQVRHRSPMECVVLDFGVVKPVDDRAPITGTGESVGTIAYAAPEQLTTTELSAAADLFSVGALGWAMLCGPIRAPLWLRPPGSTPEFQRPVSPNLADLIESLLHRDPTRRPQSATEALAVLDQQTRTRELNPALHDRAPRPSEVDVRMLWTRAAGAGLLVAILAFAWFVQDMPVPDPVPNPVEARRRVLPAPAPPQLPSARDSGSDAPLAGCAPRPTGFRKLSMLRGLAQVEWDVYVPPDLVDQPVPLLVMLHQFGDAPLDFVRYSGMVALADQKRFVVAAPTSRFSDPWLRDGDADGVVEIIEHTRAELCVDPDQVFALGNGYGGAVVEELPCKTPLAGIATTNFRSDQRATPCVPEAPVPYIHLASLKDGYNPVGGGRGCSGVHVISLAEKERRWRERNGCDGKPTQSAQRDGVCFTWSCGAPLRVCHVDGGHNWPGLPDRRADYRNCDGAPARFEFRDTIWRFFEDQLPG